MTDSLSIAVHAFASCVSMSLSFDETLLPKKIICLHIVKWFKVLLCITHNSIKHHSFICTLLKCQTVLFNLLIEPYQVLPLQARVDMGTMVMKRYSAFPKSPIRLFRIISRTFVGVGSYSSTEMQSVYSTTPVDWAGIPRAQTIIGMAVNIMFRSFSALR